jgi:hypothetical protein
MPDVEDAARRVHQKYDDCCFAAALTDGGHLDAGLAGGGVAGRQYAHRFSLIL